MDVLYEFKLLGNDLLDEIECMYSCHGQAHAPPQ